MPLPPRHLRGLALALTLLPPASRAEEAASCRRVRAEAAFEAARLVSPRVVVQALRFPQDLSGLPLTGADATGAGSFQARAGLAFEPLELVKGVTLLRAAEEDCEAHAARLELEAWSEHAEEAARLPALQRQLEFLRAQQARWRALVEVQERAFASQAITVFEFHQVRGRALALDRRLAQASGEVARLAARRALLPSAPMQPLAARWQRHALLLERQRAAIRGLSSWNLRFTGGFVGSSQAPDWYGMAEFSVHLGALAQDALSRRELEARAEELRTEQGGAARRAVEASRHLRLLESQVRQELKLVDDQLSSLEAARTALARSESPNATWAATLLSLDTLTAQAERASLAAYAEALATLAGEETP